MSAKKLVVVESPAKAKTLSRYLGRDFVVKASVGHVVDLPKNKLGVDVDNDFQPEYEIIHGKGKVIAELRSALKGKDAIYLGPDPDREGEAIAYPLGREGRPEGVQGQGLSRSLQRDHQERGARGDRPSRRDRRAQVRGSASAPSDRPPGGLPDQPAALGEGASRALGRSRAVRRGAAHRRARARDRRVPSGRVLADHGDARGARHQVRRAPRPGRQGQDRDPRSRSRRPEVLLPPRRSAGESDRRQDRSRQAMEGRVRQGDATSAQARAAVHHVDASAGSVAQARLSAASDDEHRAAPL